jgi:prepilin-type processing-associated H-X9-DG protein
MQMTTHNYLVNYANTSLDQKTLAGYPYLGAPFNAKVKPGVGVTLAEISDGTSGTLMMAEVRQAAGQDLRGFFWWGDGAGFETFQAPNTSTPNRVYAAFFCVSTPPNPPCTVSTAAEPTAFYARSQHPGGVNTAMCDASVRFVENNVNIDTWPAMGTSKGGELIDGPN